MFVFIFAIPTSIQRCPIPSLFLAYAYEKPRKGCFRTTSSVVDVCGRGWRGTLCCRRGFGLYSLKKESCNDRRSSCFRGRLDSKHLGRNFFSISAFSYFSYSSAKYHVKIVTLWYCTLLLLPWFVSKENPGKEVMIGTFRKIFANFAQCAAVSRVAIYYRAMVVAFGLCSFTLLLLPLMDRLTSSIGYSSEKNGFS